MNWRNDTMACIGEPSVWFISGEGKSEAKAKAICAGCPLLTPCCVDQLTVEEQNARVLPGIVGGLSGADRLAFHRQRGVPTDDPDGVTLPWGNRHGACHSYRIHDCRCRACKEGVTEAHAKSHASSRGLKGRSGTGQTRSYCN